MPLFLFDIDLTMVQKLNEHDRPMERAFRELTGFAGETVRLPRFDGKTDLTIIPEIYRLNGYEMRESDWQPFYERYFRYLEEHTRTPGNWEMFAGVEEILTEITRRNLGRLALLTGNHETSARIKLAPFDLNRWFPAGAFGNDSAHRPALVPIAIERAEKFYQTSFARSETVIIGDAVGDVLAAKEGGVGILAINTGIATKEELAEAGATEILPSLAETDKAVAALERILALAASL